MYLFYSNSDYNHNCLTSVHFQESEQITYWCRRDFGISHTFMLKMSHAVKKVHTQATGCDLISMFEESKHVRWLYLHLCTYIEVRTDFISDMLLLVFTFLSFFFTERFEINRLVRYFEFKIKVSVLKSKVYLTFDI